MKYPSYPESSTSPFPTECLSTLTLHASVLRYFDWIYYLLSKWTISSSLPVSLWDSCFSFNFYKTVGKDGVWHTLIYNLFSGRTSSKSPITHKGFQAVILNGEIEDTVWTKAPEKVTRWMHWRNPHDNGRWCYFEWWTQYNIQIL